MLTGFGCEAGDLDAATRLAVVAHELVAASDALDDLVAGARSVAADTAWSAPAAEGFVTASEAWAGDVSGVRCLLETAVVQTRQAQVRAALPRGACL